MSTQVHAQTNNGGGADNKWTTGANWIGGIPPLNIGGTAVVAFTGSTQLTSDMDANWDILSLTFNGGTGALVLGSTGNFTLTIRVGGIINNSTNLETISNAITLGTAQLWNATFGDLAFGGNIATGGNLLTISGGANTSVSGVISGTGGLIKSGGGTLSLSGTNTYTGATTISGGGVNIQNAAALGSTAAGTTVISGSALQIQGGIAVGAEALTLNGSGISNDGALRSISGNNSWSGNIALALASTIGADAGNLTLTGLISGGFALTKVGSGTLTLSGANTYIGLTTISRGVVNIQNAAALGSAVGGTIVNNGAALQIQGGIDVGGEALTLNGSGIANDGALRNISGTNRIGGTIMLGSDATIGSDSGTLVLTGSVNNAGFLMTETGAGDVTISGVLSGTGGLTKEGTGTLALGGSSDNTFTGTTTVNAGILALAKSAGTNALAGSLVIGDNANPAAAATVRLFASDQFQGTTAVTINSSGVLDLNGNNQTVGATILYSGDIAGASVTTGAGTIVLGDTLTLAVGGMGTIGATIAGHIGDGGVVQTIFVNDGAADADLTISAVMQGLDGYIKDGPGRLLLTGANTNSGSFTVASGPVQLQNANAIASFSSVTVASGGALELAGGVSFNATAVTINGDGVGATGAFLNVTGDNSFAGNITLTSASTIASVGGTLTQNGQIINNGFLVTVGGTGNVTIAGTISGQGGLSKIDGGTLTLSGTADNTYSGVTSVNDGTLQLGMPSGVKAFSGTLTVGDGSDAASSAVTRWLASNQAPALAVTVLSDGLMDLNNFSDTIGSLTMTGGNVSTGTGTLTLGDTVTGNASATSATISGNLALGGDRTFNIARGTAAQDMIVSAIVSGGFAVTKDGAGTLVFSGANTYTGATTVSAGVLNIQNSDALGTTGNGTTVSSGAALQIQGGITVGAESLTLNGNGIVNDGALRNMSGNNSWNGNITLGSASTIVSDSGALTLSGTVTNGGFTLAVGGASNTIANGIISGTGGLTKHGAGILTLTAGNTYTGDTTVNGGSLFVNNPSGSGTGTGNVTVNGSATLGGNGTISGTVTVALGANLSPGATGSGSTAILRTGNLTLTSGANFILDLINTTAGTGYDQMSVTGGVNITGSTLVLNPGAGLSVGNKFFVLLNDASNLVNGIFSQGTTITSGSDIFLINYADNGDGGPAANDISLTLTNILPEASTWISWIVPVAALAFHERRQLRKLLRKER